MSTAPATTEPAALIRTGCYVGGEEVLPDDGRYLPSYEPASGRPWAEVLEAPDALVDAAVESARRAAPAWRATEPARRGRLLWALADLVDRHSARLGQLESRDNGKTLREAGGEVRGAADYLRYYAGLADKVGGQHLDTRRDTVITTSHEPYGVIGAITSWNSPFYQAVRKAAPALAAGNAVVLKPAEQTSHTALELARMAVDAGIPAGVLNVVTGTGAGPGRALAAHPGVAKVTMTGGVAAAESISRVAADKLMPLSFELGGGSPHLVFADADLDQAVIGAVNGAFGGAGQSCTAGSRLLVERRCLERFTEAFLAAVAELRVGDPCDPRSQIGAIATLEQLRKIEATVALARDEGATLLAGGGRPTEPPLDQGWFHHPTVLASDDPGSSIVRDEVFGPVVVLVPFDDEDHAVAIANGLPAGLTAGLWTTDLARAHRVSRSLEVGMVWVNSFRTVHPSAPYGGWRRSGYGREDGLEGLLAYTQTKTVMIDLAPSARPDLFELRGLGVGRTT